MEELRSQKMPGGRSCGHFFERLIHFVRLISFVLQAQKYDQN